MLILEPNVTYFNPFLPFHSIWAFATVGFGYDETCGTNVHNEYVHVATNDSAGDKELVYETLEVIAENALQRLDRFKAQGEAAATFSQLNMCWSSSFCF